MAAPTSTAEFLDLVRKSGVLDDARLDALAADPTLPAVPAALARRLIRGGLLTEFQAKNLLVGKFRRLVIAGKYKLLELIGSGGMGAVYLCEHAVMHRLVALKVLPVNKLESQGPATLERFLREARAVGQLDHPNIIRAHDIDKDDGLHFLVLEYVDGASLQEIVASHGPMDPVRAAHYVAQAAVGLDHAHVAGLIHRDIQPGNILLDRAGTVKVLDLGLARYFNASSHDDNVTAKYDEGSILGTADYLAPEQGIPGPIDPRADIYSLGATFYFLLAGKAPFEEGTISQKMLWHQARNPKPISELRSDVPPEMLAVLDGMMAKAPGDRYQTMHDVADALHPWTDQPISPPPEDEMPRRNRGARAAAGPASPGRPVRRTVPPRATPRLPDLGDTPAVSNISETAPLPRPAPVPADRPVSHRSSVLPLVTAAGATAIVGLSVALIWLNWTRSKPLPPTVAEASPAPTPDGLEHPSSLSDAPPVLTPAEAQQRENQRCTVKMVVDNVGHASGLYFLDSGDPRDPTHFTIVVGEKLLPALNVQNKAELEARFKGQAVHVTGVVTRHKSDYQIQIKSAADLVRLAGPTENTP